ncbi:MAG: hypothetical protein RRZ83_00950 [Alistipes sp.]
MKKFNLWTLLMAALAICSCSNNNDEALLPSADQTMQVMVRIETSSLTTKAISAPTTEGSTIPIQNGTVFFISAQGYIVSRGAINKTQLVTGQLFKGVNFSATEVYIVANYLAGSATETKLAACTTKNEILSLTESIVTLTGIDHLVLVNITPTSGADAAIYDAKIKPGTPYNKAYVLLCPTLARLEITDIKTVDPVIVKYSISGLYIDNFYSAFYMACNKGGAEKRVFGGQINNLNNNTYPNRDGHEVTSDSEGTIRATSISTGGIWCYHATPTSEIEMDLPRIVVVFKSITIRIGTTTRTYSNKFLTVTGYVDSTNTPIAKLEAGKIYRTPAGGFMFRYGDLTETPNPSKLEVTINMNILPWQEIIFPPVVI